MSNHLSDLWMSLLTSPQDIFRLAVAITVGALSLYCLSYWRRRLQRLLLRFQTRGAASETSSRSVAVSSECPSWLPALRLFVESDSQKWRKRRDWKRAVAFVNTKAHLRQVARYLALSPVIGVDVEHHAGGSYEGTTCLLQVSDGSCEFVIDALALRDSIGELMGPLFSDGSVVKVLYGADNDVTWLQRDFGLRLNGLFDVRRAVSGLGMRETSLVDLWKRTCGFEMSTAEKHLLQISDWSQRPLSAEQLLYARVDVSFLPRLFFLSAAAVAVRDAAARRRNVGGVRSQKEGVQEVKEEEERSPCRTPLLLLDHSAEEWVRRGLGRVLQEEMEEGAERHCRWEDALDSFVRSTHRRVWFVSSFFDRAHSLVERVAGFLVKPVKKETQISIWDGNDAVEFHGKESDDSSVGLQGVGTCGGGILSFLREAAMLPELQSYGRQPLGPPVSERETQAAVPLPPSYLSAELELKFESLSGKEFKSKRQIGCGHGLSLCAPVLDTDTNILSESGSFQYTPASCGCYHSEFKRAVRRGGDPDGSLEAEAFFAFLFALRDHRAREADEAPECVMPTDALLEVSNRAAVEEERCGGGDALWGLAAEGHRDWLRRKFEVGFSRKVCFGFCPSGIDDNGEEGEGLPVPLLWRNRATEREREAEGEKGKKVKGDQKVLDRVRQAGFASMEALREEIAKQPPEVLRRIERMRDDRKARYLSFCKRFAAKKQVYENCELLAPDGTLLSHCDSKKVQWYLDKGLADLETEKPLRIRLRFEPTGRSACRQRERELSGGTGSAAGAGEILGEEAPHRGRGNGLVPTGEAVGEEEEKEESETADRQQIQQDLYYVSPKENRCVVCGSRQHFLRFHVVPSCYRTHFPAEFKSHGSHDVLLLCVPCHERANAAFHRLRLRLSEEAGCPLHFQNEQERSEAAKAHNAKKAATALVRALASMPEGRIASLCGQTVKWLESLGGWGREQVRRAGRDELEKLRKSLQSRRVEEERGRKRAEEMMKGSISNESESESESIPGSPSMLFCGDENEGREVVSNSREKGKVPPANEGISAASHLLSHRSSDAVVSSVRCLAGPLGDLGPDEKGENLEFKEKREILAKFLLLCEDKQRTETEEGGAAESEGEQRERLSEAAVALLLGTYAHSPLKLARRVNAKGEAEKAGKGEETQEGGNGKKGVRVPYDHGRCVVAAIQESGDKEAIPDLVRRCRVFFVHEMAPKFLPENWAVDHKVARSFGEKSVFTQES
uniref:3'-5' exonuclease domain-containing protein n=1 Tax=Chromera velia CCMP2878 TaxID=1169474 RepID=A0A0G4I5E9_9ALVE|eukprot:Cvel_11156.t1-p1 / transcript=Cvel_11156.t1 / gene=Cvel_11156 / organism=Chromera_velia_CCMP2878 / gene_product=Exosome complex exonuclease RRP6, putative / transcript_product=Exosome complex exonuclease RRP6, putative / location=Cvel_scaffold692:20137-29843(-) / protein_length=1242 / sequence_SO=supercontig / SO=protein_coding / is_pseudo=false